MSETRTVSVPAAPTLWKRVVGLSIATVAGVVAAGILLVGYVFNAVL